ncbi:MAG: homoserine O-acetyltransferase [Kiritimatiellae bacterium]|nr:homoserine O-acetyltransferase [Kiritimatiellia bacterium]
MSTEQTRESVGVVEVQRVDIALPEGGLRLESGGVLPELTVAYETYGELSPERDNVIFICHALTGDAHVAGWHESEGNAPGWWDDMVGPGKGIDTRYYHVICANILGGCKGTTGPSSVNPETGKSYGSAFPAFTVGDVVDVHCLLLKHLGIERLAAVIGGSFGGMQALEWTVRYPDMIAHCISVASATSLSAQALSFDVISRNAILSDPDWQDGDYYETGRMPSTGLAQARQIGHITYLSSEIMTNKFGREKRSNDTVDTLAGHAVFRSDFQVESYLQYQGEKFLQRFDANSYLHITRTLDEYDLESGFESLDEALERVKAKVLVVALSSDWLFPARQSVELANGLLRAGKQVSYCLLEAPHGHDAFLVHIEHLTEVLRAFLPWVTPSPTAPQAKPRALSGRAVPGRSDYDVFVRESKCLAEMVQPNSRVLDLGCGDGHLLEFLKETRSASGMGVDIDLESVIRVIDSGIDIFQEDIDEGLGMIPDGSYDFAVLNETIQVVRRPRFVVREMLRVAREAIVTFPNFGKWNLRLQLALRGRMPKNRALPFEWYDTPNIHLFTLRDFIDLCDQDNIRIAEKVCIPHGRVSELLVGFGQCNLGADRVVVRVARS